jgi:hypothetical protein
MWSSAPIFWFVVGCGVENPTLPESSALSDRGSAPVMETLPEASEEDAVQLRGGGRFLVWSATEKTLFQSGDALRWNPLASFVAEPLESLAVDGAGVLYAMVEGPGLRPRQWR